MQCNAVQCNAVMEMEGGGVFKAESSSSRPRLKRSGLTNDFASISIGYAVKEEDDCDESRALYTHQVICILRQHI